MRLFRLFGAAFLLILLTQHCAVGAEFFRKQTGTVVLAGSGSASSVTVTIDAVCTTQSFLVFSTTVDDANPGTFHIGGQITNSTTLTFTRFNNNTTPVTIKWQVFEFEGNVSVQRGTTTPGSGTTNVAISAVNTANSFVIASMSNDGSTMGDNDGFTANLTSGTNLQFGTQTGGGNFTIYWQVIEYLDADVQKITASLTATNTFVDAAITGVDLSKTMLISSHTVSANVEADDLPRAEFTSTTNVRFSRVGNEVTLSIVAYVVEFTDLTTVSSGSQAFGSGVTTQNVAITAAGSSGVFGTGNMGRQGSTNFGTTDNVGHAWVNYEITSATNLAIDRGVGTGSTATIPWQIVTFEDANTSPATYYSFASGAWDANTSWSLTSDGSSGAVAAGVYPRRTDNVVIRTGHNITINAVDDNGLCGLSPGNLSRINVGTFTGSADLMFYHIGDILVASGGTLTSSEEMMIEGYTLVENGGTFTITEDIINLGYFEIAATANFTNTDDLILSGNSITIINNTSFGADDIYIDHTNATLCGEGIMNLGNGGVDPTIQFFNGGSLNQVCSTFSVTCTSNCGAFPITPTGSFSSGNSGPGGVGSTTGSGDVRLWLDANTIVQADATNVSSWTDQSGYGNDATAVATFEPVFNTNQLNGFPDVHFTAVNSDYLRVADDNSLDPVAVSLFAVGNHTINSGGFAGYISKIRVGVDPFDGYALVRNGATTDIAFTIDALTNAVVGGNTYGTNTILSGVYDQVDLELSHNGASQGTDLYTNNVVAHSNFLYLGAISNPGGGGVAGFLDGDIAEAIVFGRGVNDAERIIVDNYLSAKYNLPLAGNDVYTMDDAGDYDFEVAGIGQAADGSNHRDARGTGLVRMWNPNNLGNSEFLIWGHDNTAITTTTTASPADVDGTVIEERLSRIWRVSETGDVGNVSISFDFSGVGGSPLGSNLRLLIDRDGDGFGDNDVTPITGTVSNGIAVFSNVNFVTGDRFTLGNTDASTPLPIELIEFTAKPFNANVLLTWETASELDNDYFTVERSGDAESWESVITIQGAGTTDISNSYEAVDYQPLAGLSYYRLKQTDFDGTVGYSGIEVVKLNPENQLVVSPNPSRGSFVISGSQDLNASQIRVFNSLGQMIKPGIHKDNELSVDLHGFPQGVYVLQVTYGLSVKSIRLMKN